MKHRRLDSQLPRPRLLEYCKTVKASKADTEPKP
jgi:hypothetical protein